MLWCDGDCSGDVASVEGYTPDDIGTCADALNHICGTRLTKYQRLGIDHLAVPLNMNRKCLQSCSLQ